MPGAGDLSRVVALSALVAGGSAVAVSGQPAVVVREEFDAGLDGWEQVRLDRRQTSYTTAAAGGDQVLVATSENSAAAFVRELETPVPARATMRWRWRVTASLTENERERERRGDDYAARVFVTFGGEPFDRSTRALSYVWAGREQIGARYRNPVAKNVATIVLQSGDGAAGRWVREQRDLVRDYREAFGEDPPEITGIAVLVDTDDTSSSAISWFDDFVLEVQPAESGRVQLDDHLDFDGLIPR
jgi:hypothetical protein